MKKNHNKLFSKLTLCAGLALTLAPFSSAAVFAMEEEPEEECTENCLLTENEDQEDPNTITVPEETETVPGELTEDEPEVLPEETPAPETETEQDEILEEGQEPVSEETPAPEAEASADPMPEETPDELPAMEVSGEEEPEEPVEESDEAEDNDVLNAGPAGEEEELLSDEEETGSEPAGEETSAVTVTIGDTSFSLEDDETSHWNNGQGWKNLAGSYIAMVDYDGSGETVSADGGIVTLAVAGVNRIGSLEGNCSYRITGAGIVLLDNIDITKGNTITLHTDTSLYEKGSAAVFLKQDGEVYKLINGSIPGILDEEYYLDNVKLRIPNGSVLFISCMGIRTERYFSEEEDDYLTDVSYFLTPQPWQIYEPEHGGEVNIVGSTGILNLGKSSTLFVDNGGTVLLNEVDAGRVPGQELGSIAGGLNISGSLQVSGTVEGGLVDILEGASVSGDGSILSSIVSLRSGGNFDKNVLLDQASLDVYDGVTSLSATIKDSTIYMRGSRTDLEMLDVSGESYVSHFGGINSIGDISLQSGAVLGIVINEHSYAFAQGEYLQDSALTINGTISGDGSVNVLAGLVIYNGPLTGIIPAVPGTSAARLYSSSDITSSVSPLIMSDSEITARLQKDEVPLDILYVQETLLEDDILARKWVVTMIQHPEPLERTATEYTCASFLEALGLAPENDYTTAVEVIGSELTRNLYFLEDTYTFTLEDAVMVRVLYCTGIGGQGGSTSTHTVTNFTGNGTLGGTGDGSVQSGDGTVIFGEDQPVPDDPVPPEPTPDPTPEPTPVPDNNGKEKDDTSSKPDTSSEEPQYDGSADADTGERGYEANGGYQTAGGTVTYKPETVYVPPGNSTNTQPADNGHSSAEVKPSITAQPELESITPVDEPTEPAAREKSAFPWIWILIALVTALLGIGGREVYSWMKEEQ